MTMIDADRVNHIFNECLWSTADRVRDRRDIEGVVHQSSLHIGRMMHYREDIVRFLDELPIEFHVDGGRGWSFLQACVDRNGNQWTGLHLRMEQLFQLGIGIGCASYLLPREMWDRFAGGMPYIVIHPQGAHTAP